MTEDQKWEVIQQVCEALTLADSTATHTVKEVTYETMQKAGFNRPTNWRRKYNLSDARQDARNIAARLRAAWEILEPMSKG